MRVEFRKITRDYKDFSIELADSLKADGKFKKVSNSIVSISFKISGFLPHDCDMCAESFDLEVNQEIDVSVSDKEYNGEEIDIIEVYNGFIDFDEVVQSELEAFKSDYHCCIKCKID